MLTQLHFQLSTISRLSIHEETEILMRDLNWRCGIYKELDTRELLIQCFRKNQPKKSLVGQKNKCLYFYEGIYMLKLI